MFQAEGSAYTMARNKGEHGNIQVVGKVWEVGSQLTDKAAGKQAGGIMRQLER